MILCAEIRTDQSQLAAAVSERQQDWNTFGTSPTPERTRSTMTLCRTCTQNLN